MLETQSKMKRFSLSVWFVEYFAWFSRFLKFGVIMGCLFSEIMRFCSKNNVWFIYFFFSSAEVLIIETKSRICFQLLLLHLFLIDKRHLTNFISVCLCTSCSKITHWLILCYLCVHFHNLQHFYVHTTQLGISVKLRPCPTASHFIYCSDWKLIQFLCTWHLVPSIANAIKPPTQQAHLLCIASWD